MDLEVNLGIATSGHQCIGYWGYGNPGTLAELLRTSLREITNWELSFQFPDDGVLATISASGLAATHRSECFSWVSSCAT
jgi:hypothetical protein